MLINYIWGLKNRLDQVSIISTFYYLQKNFSRSSQFFAINLIVYVVYYKTTLNVMFILIDFKQQKFKIRTFLREGNYCSF